MISSVCRGVRSDVESRVLSLQLFPQEPSYSCRLSADVHRKGEEVVEENFSRNRRGNGENGDGWSLLEALSRGNGTGIHENEKEEKVYVHHPVVKLSKKSLEMCTESLGSESGSDMGENDMSLLSLEGDIDDHDSIPNNNNIRCCTWLPKKPNRRRKDATFPPPLTSISSGSSSTCGVRVESYREDGRLVLRAVTVTSASRTSYFHTERSHGRLKLLLVKDMENRAQEVDEQVAVEVFGDLDHDHDQVFSTEVEEEEEEAYWGNEESHHDGQEMGIQNFGRPSSCSCSCKEDGQNPKELLNWEPLWVST